MSGTIVIVDEEGPDARKLMRQAARSSMFIRSELLHMHPLPTVDETLSKLFSSGCEMLISDYRLGENDTSITYSGVDLVNAARNAREDLPCFLATSYPASAIREDIDPKMIFSKGEISAERVDDEIHFFDRARTELDRWRKDGERLQQEHDELRQLMSKRELTGAELDRLVVVDTALERRLMNSQTDLNDVKRLAQGEMADIIEKATALVLELQKNLDVIEKEKD